MGYVGGTQVVYSDSRLTDAAFERQVKELEIAFELIARHRTIGEKNGALWEAPEAGSQDAKRRKRVADVLEKYRPVLAETTSGFVLVTGSPIMRGILRAIFWLAPPPYPWSVAATPLDGFQFLAKHTPGLEPQHANAQYKRLLDLRFRR